MGIIIAIYFILEYKKRFLIFWNLYKRKEGIILLKNVKDLISMLIFFEVLKLIRE